MVEVEELEKIVGFVRYNIEDAGAKRDSNAEADIQIREYERRKKGASKRNLYRVNALREKAEQGDKRAEYLFKVYRNARNGLMKLKGPRVNLYLMGDKTATRIRESYYPNEDAAVGVMVQIQKEVREHGVDYELDLFCNRYIDWFLMGRSPPAEYKKHPLREETEVGMDSKEMETLLKESNDYYDNLVVEKGTGVI